MYDTIRHRSYLPCMTQLDTAVISPLFDIQVQKKVYRIEKKKAAKEILTTLRDPTVVLLADYLKVRGMLKSWTKFWCVLKPGILILYKSQKQKVNITFSC